MTTLQPYLKRQEGTLYHAEVDNEVEIPTELGQKSPTDRPVLTTIA